MCKNRYLTYYSSTNCGEMLTILILPVQIESYLKFRCHLQAYPEHRFLKFTIFYDTLCVLRFMC